MRSPINSVRVKKAFYLACIPVLFLAGLGLSRTYDLEFALHRSTAGSGAGYVPTYQPTSGPQLVMVYLGSAGCPWSNDASLPATVEAIKLQLARHSQQQEMSFKAVGVAIDWSTQRGLEHLTDFGEFDEISAGYNWGNTLGLRYLWSGNSVRAETPQVIIYERHVTAPEVAGDPLHYAEAGRRTVVAKAGLREITEWAESGMSIPSTRGGAM